MKRGILPVLIALALAFGVLSTAANADPESTLIINDEVFTFEYDADDAAAVEDDDDESVLAAVTPLLYKLAALGDLSGVTTINASGPLDMIAFAFLRGAILAFSVEGAGLNEVNVEASAPIPGALVGSDGFDGSEWDDIWEYVAENYQDLKLNPTLNGIRGPDAANSNSFVAILAEAGVKLGVVTLDDSSLTLPEGHPRDILDKIVMKGDSELDLSNIDKDDLSGADVKDVIDASGVAPGSKIILPEGLSPTQAALIIQRLAGEIPDLTVSSGVNGTVWDKADLDEALPRGGSSGGCDAGFGFGGLLALAGAALLGRCKRR
ncbi:MAG: hypothetical protein LBR87_07285 [Synergistaceae bacterium]|jgi:hypothetical protein|nr:hypothetical protein [Synergistaceae bacterium]